MTILVTGSAGHLGEALVRMLRQQGRPVRGLDIQESPFTDMVGSIVDPEVCKAAMKGGITAVLHTASLHKPHVETHSRQDFVDVNITGTLNLLEAAVEERKTSSTTGSSSSASLVFIFTSTTSAFGDALKPTKDDPKSVWIDETVQPIPKNIYGVTKLAAENMCELFFKLYQLPCIVLKVARFFSEDDDSKEVRGFCTSENAKVNELLYRRADIYDMVTAHFQAIEKAPEIGFDRLIICSTSPFQRNDRALLTMDPGAVVRSYYPELVDRVFTQHNFRMFDTIDRVYRNDRARERLNWTPKYTFETALQQLELGEPIGSALSREVGIKGYHGSDVVFEGELGPFPTIEISSK